MDIETLWRRFTFEDVPSILRADEPPLAEPPHSPPGSTARMIEAALSRHLLLRGSPGFMAAVRELAQEVHLAPGTRIVDTGKQEPAVFLVLEGQAKVVALLPADRAPDLHVDDSPVTMVPRVVGRMGPGMWIGLAPLAWHDLRRSSGTTREGLEAALLACSAQLETLEREREKTQNAAEVEARAQEIAAVHAELLRLELKRMVWNSPQSAVTVEVLPRAPGNPSEFRALRLSIDQALALVERFPPFRTLIHQSLSNRYRTLPELERLLGGNSLLGALDPTQRELLMQLSVHRRYVRTAALNEVDRPYLSAGAPSRRVALLLKGRAQVYLPSGPDHGPQLAADLGPGDFVGHEALVRQVDLDGLHRARLDEIEVPQEDGSGEVEDLPRSTDVYLSDDAELLEVDWRSFRWILESRTASWLAAMHWYHAGCSEKVAGHAQVVAFLAQEPALGTTTLAYGLALALLRSLLAEEPELHEALDPGDRPVIVLDLEGDRTARTRWGPLGYAVRERVFRRPSETAAPDIAREVTLRHLECTDTRQGDPLSLGKMNVVWPAEPEAAPEVLATLRSLPGARVVIVTGITRGTPYWEYLAEALTGVEVTVAWVTDDPGAVYDMTADLPFRLVRIDRMSPRYRSRAATRAQEAQEAWDRDEQSPFNHPPLADAQVRIPQDDAGARLFDRLEIDRLWAQAQAFPLARAFQRLERVVRRRTVGIALGGGGMWGAAHIALLRELELAGVPVDYVAGTSFGSVVAGLYAAGGMRALLRLLEESCPRGVEAGGPRAILKTLRTSAFFRATTIKSLTSTQAVQEVIDGIVERSTGQARMPLSCTEIPFYPVSTNLDSCAPFTTWAGSVGFGVRASSGMPPSLPGMWFRGQRILDGAMVANVPAEIVRNRGADYVISANVVAPRSEPHETGHLYQKVYDATFRRLTDTVRGMFLLGWKAGDDQGRLRADFRVDLWTEGAELADWWKGWSIVEGTRRSLYRDHVAWHIREHWLGQRSGDSAPYARVRTRVQVESSEPAPPPPPGQTRG